jgi:predicted nucleic-acid-binding Zn-ribbon protein
MTISTTIRGGASPLFANQGALGRGDESLGSRYFKPFRGIVLREAMKRHCIKVDVLIDQFQATGGSFAKMFDVQNKKFTTVSCRRCGYTELYKGDTSTLMNILDFLTD